MKSKIDKEILKVRLGVSSATNQELAEHNVNPYTIKYDTNIEQFFKQFTPRTQSGILGTMGLAAGSLLVLGASSVLPVVATIGGAAVLAITTAGFATNRVISNTRAYSKVKFANRGVGGTEFSKAAMEELKECSRQLQDSKKKEFTVNGIKFHSRKELKDHMKDLDGSIGFVEIVSETAKISRDVAILLNRNQNSSKLAYNGTTYSRKQLEKIAEQNEIIAYQGLTHLLDKGLEISDEIKNLDRPKNKDEQRQYKEFLRIMDRISDCVEGLASEGNRPALGFDSFNENFDNYNPYKRVIVEAIGKGCLLGDDEQNKRIINIAKQRKGKKINQELALQQYSNMYEAEAVKQLDEEKNELLQTNRDIAKEYQATEEILDELPQKDHDIAQVKAGNVKARERVSNKIDYNALIRNARIVASNMPSELKDDKEELIAQIQKFSTSINQGDQEQIEADRLDLDELVVMSYGKINAAYHTRGKKEAKLEFDKAFTQYKNASDALIAQKEAEAAKEKAKHETMTKVAWSKRAKAKELKKQLEESKKTSKHLEGWAAAGLDKVDELQTQIGEKDKELKVALGETESLRSKHQETSRMLAKQIAKNIAKDKELDEVYGSLDEASGYVMRTTHELMMEKYNSARLQEENSALKDNLDKTNAKLSKKTAENKKAKVASKKAEQKHSLEITALQAERDEALAESQRLHDKNTRLQKQADLAGVFFDGATSELATTRTKLTETKVKLDIAEAQNRALTRKATAAKKLSAAKSNAIRAKNTEITNLQAQIRSKDDALARKNEEIDNLNEEINQRVQGNLQNIDTIMGLQVENEKLAKQNANLSAGNAELQTANKVLTDKYNNDTADLAYERYQAQKRIEQILYERDTDARYIDDLERSNQKLTEANEELEDKLDYLEGKKQAQTYHRDLGAANRRRANTAYKVAAHVDYTKKNVENYDKGTVDLLDHYTDTILSRDPAAQSIDDINYDKDMLSGVYKATKSGLAPLSKKKLKEVTDEYKEEQGIKK